MSFDAGTKLGAYEVVGPLGAGGMSARGHADALRRGGIGVEMLAPSPCRW